MLTTKQKIGLARTANGVVRFWRSLCGKKMRGQFQRSGLNWQLDLNEGIDFSIYCLGSFEPKTVSFYSQLVASGHIVFDVGANIGAHTLHFARLVGNTGQVYAFEPTISALRKLEDNLTLNPTIRPQVQTFHAFCSNPADAAIPTAIYSSWPLRAESELHPNHLGSLQAVGEPQLIVLDELVSRLNIPRVDLIKLDVDGNEIKVLRGCKETIRRYHPKVIAEISPYTVEENGYDMEEFWSVFRANGYRMRTFDSTKEIPLETDYFRRTYPQFSSVNVLLF